MGKPKRTFKEAREDLRKDLAAMPIEVLICRALAELLSHLPEAYGGENISIIMNELDARSAPYHRG